MINGILWFWDKKKKGLKDRRRKKWGQRGKGVSGEERRARSRGGKRD